MKLVKNKCDVAFDMFDTSIVKVNIVNNIIIISSRDGIPFSTEVVNHLRTTFNEYDFICDFDDHSLDVIYIKPIKKGLTATIEMSKCVVKCGFTTIFYDVAGDNIEED
jgi:hypothetical protein